MDQLLRDPQLAWEGYVITDAGSITFMTPPYHNFTSTLVDAACLAMNAGTDLALGSEFASTLATCVAQGNVTDARLRQALTRVMRKQFEIGWFDSIGALKYNLTDPVPFNSVGDANISTPAARALSHRAALESFVLLKNARATLPLSAVALRRLALVGPTADWDKTSTGSYIGNYSPCEDGPGGKITDDARCHVVTLLEALQARAAVGGWALGYAAGCDVNTQNSTGGFAAALAAAAGADVIVFAGGLDTCQETACSEGEANDRAVDGGQFPQNGLDLGGSQLQLLAALRAAHPATPIVVVYFNGGVVSSPWTMQNADAVLEAWYPGYEGGAAIAETLFGDASPAGRMPSTVVASLADLPPHTDFSLSTPPGRTLRYFSRTPLTPFGFGLSFANFSYSGLAVAPPTLGPSDASVTVSASVRHSAGALASDEVAQLYGRFEGGGAASAPLRQLLAFERLRALAPGETRPVSFEVARADLALVDLSGQALRVLPGRWTLWLGGGPPDNEAFGGGAVLVGELTVS